MGLRVKGLGFSRVWGFKVQGFGGYIGLRVQGLKLRPWDLGVAYVVGGHEAGKA